MPAGVSADYYIRLEQSRETNPSPQVVDGLGRALRLSADVPRILFTHPRARNVFRDWKLVTSATVYALHLNAAGSATPRDQRPGPGTAGGVR